MSRAVLVLWNDEVRQQAANWVSRVAQGTRVEFRSPQRSLPQNDRLWLLLTEVAKRDWKGQRYTAEEWKDYFMHAYRGEKWMPAEDGGMVPIGRSTSQLGKDEFGELMTLIETFCSRQGIGLPWDQQ